MPVSDVTPGGLWTSSPASVAIVSASGVNGMGSGVAIVSYVLVSGGAPTGCIATKIITVNPVPSGVSGASVFCQGSTATYSDITPGGVWSGSPAAIGTVVDSTTLTMTS